MTVRVTAILETMWNWRGMTSAAGYREAPRYFRINAENFSGRRLYKLIGPGGRLLVTNACRELVSGPKHHGKGDPIWLAENLAKLDAGGPMDVLLVCGKVAQQTFKDCTYSPVQAHIIEIPHPAARLWTKEKLAATALEIQTAMTTMKK